MIIIKGEINISKWINVSFCRLE